MTYCPSIQCWQLNPCLQCQRNDSVSNACATAAEASCRSTDPQLVAFLRSRGCLLEGVALVPTPNAGIGLFATSQTPRVAIVQSAWLNGAAVLRDSALGVSFRSLMLSLLEQDIQLSPRQLILCFLIVVRSFQSTMKLEWAAYVNSLPPQVDLPSCWPDSCLELNLLQATELGPAVGAKARALAQEHQALLPDLTTIFPADREWFTLAAWVWADSVHWSRVLSVGEAWGASETVPVPYPGAPTSLWEESLIPFVDFMNHSATPSVRWSMGSYADSPAITLIPTGELRGSEELTISYGEKPNAEYLFHYGFVPWGPLEDSVGLPFPFVGSDSLLDVKRALLAQLGCDSPVFRVHLPGRSPIGSTALQALLSVTDLQILRICLCDSFASIEDGSLTSETVTLDFIRTVIGNVLAASCTETNFMPTSRRTDLVRQYADVQQTVLKGVLRFLNESAQH